MCQSEAPFSRRNQGRTIDPEPVFDETDIGLPPSKGKLSVKLSDLYDNDDYHGKVSIAYAYAIEDEWEHKIRFLGLPTLA